MNESNTDSIDISLSSVNVQFLLLLIVELISLMCTLLILIYTYFHWQAMVSKPIHNHAILLIILISFFYITLDLPFTISFYHLGYDIYRSLHFCQWWYWIDYTLIAMSLHVTAIASLQRYIFIFKHYLVRGHLTRWICHYFPLLSCMILSSVFYFIVIVLYPCENTYDYSEQFYCSSPCYTSSKIIIHFDWIINCILPMGITTFTHGIFISWMVCSMKTLNRQPRHIRKRHKKLTLQLFAFALLFIVGWTPSVIVSLTSLFSAHNIIDTIPGVEYLYYISYFICPLQPLICLFVLPEPIRCVQTKIRLCRDRSRKTVVLPIAVIG